MGFVIQEIHALVAVGDDGDEGIVGIKLHNQWLPFIMADKERFDALLPLAINMCGVERKELKILKFSVREDVTKKYIP